MPSADHFFSKLPAGHATTLSTKQAATALLRANTLVLPTFSYNDTVPEMRELCAAALWVHSPNYSATAVQQLPIAARNTLCRMLGIPMSPNGVAVQTARVTHTITTRLAGALNNNAAANQAAAAPAAAAMAVAAGGVPIAAPAVPAAPPPLAHLAAGGAAAAIGGGGGGPQLAAGGAAPQHPAAGGGVQQAPPPPAYAQASGAPAAAGGVAVGAGGPQPAAGGVALQQPAALGAAPPGLLPPAYVPPRGALAVAGGVIDGASGPLPAAGGAAPQQPAVGFPQALQLQPAEGAVPQLQPDPGAAQPLLVDGLITAAQAATVRALPDAVARMLVSQSGFPLTGLDPAFVVHGKLIVAAWAAEATRKAAEVRALQGPIAAQIIMLLGVDTNWPTTLQYVSWTVFCWQEQRLRGPPIRVKVGAS
jgi:hypothetical protein